MRFLFITGIYKPATISHGPIASVAGLAEALTRRGHNVTVVASLAPQPVHAQEITPGTLTSINGVDVVRFYPHAFIWQRSPFRTVRNTAVYHLGPAFEHWLKTNIFRFDAIDTQLAFLGSNGVVSRQARKSNLVYFYHQRGNLDPSHYGKNAFLKRLYIAAIEKPCLQRADRLIALSTREAKVFQQLVPHKPTTIIPNGVEIEEWNTPTKPSARLESLGLSQTNCPLILWFSRYNPMKGPDFFIDVIKVLNQRGLRFKAVMAGTDEQGLLARCKQRALNERLGDIIDILPALGGDDRRFILQRSDIFVLPTHGEAQSMAILEALACRTAVLTTPQANFPEMPRANAGYVINRDDTLGFASRIESLIHNHDTLKKVVENGYNFVAQNHNWPQIARRYEELAEREVAIKRTRRSTSGCLGRATLATSSLLGP